jgi:hypothetical protein
MRVPAAQAQTASGIEQAFSGSLTAMPSENLGVSGAFYVPVYSDRLFPHQRENGGKLPQGAGGAEAVLDH